MSSIRTLEKRVRVLEDCYQPSELVLRWADSPAEAERIEAEELARNPDAQVWVIRWRSPDDSE